MLVGTAGLGGTPMILPEQASLELEVRPGHTPVLHAGCELVEFSPTEELGKTMEVIMKNMQAAGTET